MKESQSRAAAGDQVDLGERRGARERQVLDAFAAAHVLGPDVDLRAEHAARLGRRELRGHRLEA